MMVKSVYTADLKSSELKSSCGFESRSCYQGTMENTESDSNREDTMQL